jgi:hypothetical protein
MAFRLKRASELRHRRREVGRCAYQQGAAVAGGAGAAGEERESGREYDVPRRRKAPAPRAAGYPGSARGRGVQGGVTDADYQPSTSAKISGATMVASLSIMCFGVPTASLPHVIFSFGTAPEYEP